MIERGLVNGQSTRELERAMIALLKEGRIKANEPIGRYSNRATRFGLARTGADAA
jgi:hypothetical protein